MGAWNHAVGGDRDKNTHEKFQKSGIRSDTEKEGRGSCQE